MKFGLWFEPEMVNKDSDLFRAHPDWLLADIRRNYCHSRNQYVLDFSKQEVVDYIYEQMCRVLGEASGVVYQVGYEPLILRGVSNGNSREYQGKARHKYILGVTVYMRG